MKQKLTTKNMMYIAVLSSLAVLVGMFEIPISYIGVKLDLSEVIIFSSFLILGLKYTNVVILLRSVIRFILPPLTPSQTAVDPIWKLIGEVLAIEASLLLILSLIIVRFILKDKQKPLIYETPVLENNKVSLKTFILFPIIASVVLTLGMSITHVLFTMPLSLSQYSHFTIFSFLKDPAYDSQSLKQIIIIVVTAFTLINVIKGTISSIIYLVLKPRLEKMIF